MFEDFVIRLQSRVIPKVRNLDPRCPMLCWAHRVENANQIKGPGRVTSSPQPAGWLRPLLAWAIHSQILERAHDALGCCRGCNPKRNVHWRFQVARDDRRRIQRLTAAIARPSRSGRETGSRRHNMSFAAHGRGRTPSARNHVASRARRAIERLALQPARAPRRARARRESPGSGWFWGSMTKDPIRLVRCCGSARPGREATASPCSAAFRRSAS